MAETKISSPGTDIPAAGELFRGEASGLAGRALLSSVALAAEGLGVLKTTGRDVVDGAEAVGAASLEAFDDWTPGALRPAVAPATKVVRTVQERVSDGARKLIAAV
jgi:hypothetical protein